MTEPSQQTAIGNVWSLMTVDVWAVVALTLAGMAFGVCTVALWRLWFGLPQDDLPPPDLRAYKLFLRKLGSGVSGGMTAAIVLTYLLVFVSCHFIVALLAATFCSAFAAACNRPFFKLVRWGWDFCKGVLHKKAVAAGVQTDALDETITRFRR